MNRFRTIAVAALLVATLLALGSIAEACPTCKVALSTHDKAQGDMVSGYMYSILFMLAMPFTLLGAFSTYMYVLVRRARKQNPGMYAPPAERYEHELV
ncbi:MAG TPA: hypothetical protein VG713_14050, partial [Pirellulales bacterium]|nr:hypothetical protein [Pirellulales bacterium]